ncbi:hypothetical protein H6P81_009448 [Aristolochia fimbriata]|uniref:KIB1-4 beta-propeller domain-containing protein n=1 Tax=Aristolochia fimbriata TaxID=158543 RepID=A0AAV7EKZ1_ARIFI|nr:hypothetical protein H6P81_009448 [Aristolochia fimbriata]
MTCLPNFSSAFEYFLQRSVLQWMRGRPRAGLEPSESRRSGSYNLADTVPEDVLALVFRGLNDVDDFFRLGAVCRGLHGISTNYTTEFMTKFFPWLVIEDTLWNFAIFSGVPNPCTGTIHDLVKVRDIDPKFECYGSSHGWLILVERKFGRNGQRQWLRENKVSLLNPVSGQQLTSLPDFGWPDVRISLPSFCKLVLSSNPSSSSNATGTCFVVAAVLGRPYQEAMGKDFPLAFARVDRDDHEWTRIKYDCPCKDIIYFKDKLYGITTFGTIICVEDMDEAAAGRSAASVKEIVTLHGRTCHSYNLAESQGNLLVISRFRNSQGLDHSSYRIYKLILNNVDDEEHSYYKGGSNSSSTGTTPAPAATWSEVYSLNDQTLFIGRNSCISFSASSLNCMSNCVYLSSIDGLESYPVFGVLSCERGITIPLDDLEIPSPMYNVERLREKNSVDFECSGGSPIKEKLYAITPRFGVVDHHARGGHVIICVLERLPTKLLPLVRMKANNHRQESQ